MGLLLVLQQDSNSVNPTTDRADKQEGEGAEVSGDMQSPKKISKTQPVDKKKLDKKRSLKRL